MRLADLFMGGQVNNAGKQVQQSQPVQGGAQIGRMIQNLAPGQTLQGEVVAKNGNEVQIKLSDNMVLNARLDQNMNLEVGKNMTFEVRNNGQTLTLSPLFANTATQANAFKALEMASLPINQSTVAMTGMMMEAGLSVDRNSLQQMFREINTFPGANLSDIVDLHKMGMEVNEENLAQISSYKNLTHQLMDGMHSIMGALPETMQGMVQEGNVTEAARMFQELLLMLRGLAPGEDVRGAEGSAQQAGESGQLPGDGAGMPGGGAQSDGLQPGQTVDGSLGMPEAARGTVQDGPVTELAARIADANTEALLSMVDGGQDKAGGTAGTLQPGLLSDAQAGMQENMQTRVIIAENSLNNAEIVFSDENGAANTVLNAAETSLTQELMQLIDSGDGGLSRYSGLLGQLAAAEQNGDLAGQAKALQMLLQQGIQDGDRHLLAGIVSGRAAQRVLKEGLSRLWTIEPREVADSKKVEELYQRLDRQLQNMSRILEQGGQTGSNAFKAVTNMSQNLDFLQQLNQAYTYVQLPLRLQQGEAHGDLYVYTNKRSLAAKDGQISALLHLDMEHLGPVDVYVVMQAERVNTRFYVQDDEMLDFLEAHMELLTRRLKNRGYDCDFAMQVRDGKEQTKSGLPGLLAGQQHVSPVAQYAFDVRA